MNLVRWELDEIGLGSVAEVLNDQVYDQKVLVTLFIR